MQIYAVRQSAQGVPPIDLLGAVRKVARSVPHFERCEERSLSSAGGRLQLAAVSHAREVVGTRRYVARDGDIALLYDGLPVARDGDYDAHDAGELLRRWERLPDLATGLYSAVRLDLAAGVAECLVDPLGIAQVFVHSDARGAIISNSAEVIRLLVDASDPDELGAASLFAIGWVMGRRTLLSGIEELPGGHVHRFEHGRVSSPYLTSRTLADLTTGGHPPPAADELARRLTRQVAAIGRCAGPIRCGVTAGRDTRVLVALLEAAGVDADYYTIGAEGSPDVAIARELIKVIGGEHRRVDPEVTEGSSSWVAETMRYIVQTDGLAALPSIRDWRANAVAPGPLGVRLWGMAGELGRGGVGIGTPIAPILPAVRSSYALQRRLVLKRLSDHGGIFTPATIGVATEYLDRFLRERHAEGWPVGEVAQAFYAYERIGQWSASGLRRTIASADQYSPFLTRDFIEYAFAMTPADRYLESAHHRLLSATSPRLRDLPFEIPWRPQRPERAVALALAESGRRAAHRGRRAARRRLRPVPARPARFGSRWVEAGIDQHRELVAGHRDAVLWDFVDRRRVERLLAAEPEGRWGSLEGLGRFMTAFWYLHGPREPLGALTAQPRQAVAA